MIEKNFISIRAVSISAVLVFLIAALAWGALEVTFYGGHKNGLVQGFDKTDLDMFTVQPIDSKFYSEAWFHEMQFKDEGIIANISMTHNNAGLSNGYLDAYLVVSGPGLPAIVDLSHVSPGDVKFDEKGFGMSAGGHRIELDGDIYRVKYQGKEMSADLTYKILTPSFQQGDGMVTFAQSEDFVRHNFPIPWAEISGTLTYNGKTHKLTGVGSMNHDRQMLSPLRVPTVWRGFWMYGEDLTIDLVQCLSAGFEGEWAKRLMVAERGKILFSSRDYKFEEFDIKPVSGGNLSCPRRFKIEAVHGDTWLKGEIKLVRIQEKKEALAEAPAILRQVAKVFISEIWSYRFWMDFDFEYHQDGKTRRIKGRGVGSFVDSVKAD